MFPFLVRAATPEDVATLTDMRVAFLKEIAEQYPDQSVDDAQLRATLTLYFRDKLMSGAFHAWLAQKEGHIIGTSGLVFFDRPPSISSPSGRDAYVMNMFTLPSHRGRGVASALLKATLSFVETTSASRVFLHATPQGRSLYERFGFVPGHEEMELFFR